MACVLPALLKSRVRCARRITSMEGLLPDCYSASATYSSMSPKYSSNNAEEWAE